jgi:RNase adapter protein RapZ
VREVRLHVIVLTGLAGSGKSTAIRVLEDLGFYCIDNLPAVLTPKFIELCQNSEEGITRVALGIDLRERAFLAAFPAVLNEIRSAGHRVEILYLDAADDVLVRRFSETRRPHPLAEGTDVASGIRHERDKLADLKGMADRIIDTSAFTVHQLRDTLRGLFQGALSGEAPMQVFLVSFGYKYGLPTDTDVVLDVRFLPNPFFVDELRASDGTDAGVARYVLDRPEAQEFLALTMAMMDFALPLYVREGKRYLTVGIGCTGGRHRSVALVAELERRLRKHGYPVQVRHRDAER